MHDELPNNPLKLPSMAVAGVAGSVAVVGRRTEQPVDTDRVRNTRAHRQWLDDSGNPTRTGHPLDALST
jgi:hypothetical protein